MKLLFIAPGVHANFDCFVSMLQLNQVPVIETDLLLVLRERLHNSLCLPLSNPGIDAIKISSHFVQFSF